ncbi:hypothetical protein K445DRAFT_207006 [Daldinia sp. EC12]|nr:hypothetical protein K445DRAFT_207006 [Daldinia sp. EC12]
MSPARGRMFKHDLRSNYMAKDQSQFDDGMILGLQLVIIYPYIPTAFDGIMLVYISCRMGPGDNGR